MNFIAKIVVAPMIFVLALAGYSVTPQSVIDDMNVQIESLSSQVQEQQEQISNNEIKLGAFTTSSAGTYRLNNSISSTATSINLASFKEPISNIAYTMSYIGTSVAYGTLDPQNPTKTETISFTGITQNSDGTALLTGVSRGLSRTPGTSACTASTTLATSHSGQTVFILSNPSCFYSEFAVKRNNETITGDWLVPTPANATSIVNRDYVQGLTFGGIGAASETATGTVEIATQLETASSTTNGTLGRLVIPASVATSTYNSATASLRVVTTNNSGKINSYFIATSTNASGTALGLNFQLSGTSTIATSTYFTSGIKLLDIGKNIQVITTTGTSTFTVPNGVSKVKVELVGGGGAGGIGIDDGDHGFGGGGGGAGGYSMEFVDVTATSSIQVFVGAAGEPTKFGTNGFYLSATQGSIGVNDSGGGGGVGSGGDLNLYGGYGISTTDPDLTGGMSAGGHGGNSFFGPGTRGGTTPGGGGDPGIGYGGGGGGGAGSNGSVGSGGAGAQGVIVITW